jgi:flavin reductase (DIM6/NTAB) family NADH-FMN oxidoreductase RutF
MTIDLDTFRQSLRRWASGVTVVTSKAGDELHGMTVSAFSSVSAEPPVVLVCANKSSKTHGVIGAGGVFTVNVLADDQQEISARFSSTKLEGSRFDGVPHHIGISGAPVLDGTIVSLECKTIAAYEHGTHTIYVGEVVAAHMTDKAPLLYYAGAYRAVV